MTKKQKIGIVSGYFNPLHDGHLDYIECAKKLCDTLIVIVNNDEQVRLKGSKKFLPEDIRCRILRSIKFVDAVILSVDKKDTTVVETLKLIASDAADRNSLPQAAEVDLFFFNSGDRAIETLNKTESDAIKKFGIIEVFLNLPKVNSSRDILNNV